MIPARSAFGGLLLSVVLQALVLYAPPMTTLSHTVPLAADGLLPVLALALALASSLPRVEELLKRVVRARGPGRLA